MAYRNNYFSIEPKSFSVSIKKEVALTRAQDISEREEFDLSASANLMIVNPNYRWTDKALDVPDIHSRLAWVIPFEKYEGRGEIYIDAETGEMLGGEETQ